MHAEWQFVLGTRNLTADALSRAYSVDSFRGSFEPTINLVATDVHTQVDVVREHQSKDSELKQLLARTHPSKFNLNLSIVNGLYCLKQNNLVRL